MEDAETKKAVKSAMEQYEEAVVGDGPRRAQECMQEIGKVLEKHECVLVPRCMLSPQGAEFMIEAHPRPPGQATGAGKDITGYATGQGGPNASKTRQMSKKSKSQSGKKRKKG